MQLAVNGKKCQLCPRLMHPCMPSGSLLTGILKPENICQLQQCTASIILTSFLIVRPISLCLQEQINCFQFSYNLENNSQIQITMQLFTRFQSNPSKKVIVQLTVQIMLCDGVRCLMKESFRCALFDLVHFLITS